MHLLSNTMVRSWRALGMLFFFMVISIIVFSSIMHFVERGAYFYCTATAASPIDGSPPKCNVGDISPHNSTEGLGLEECDRWANEGGSNSMSDKRLECCFGETWYAYPPTDSNGDGCADKSKFESIPATAWWCVVTMTTVGYGDVVPLTTEGKLVAMLTMIGGILILALPITVIGSNFNIEYENSEQQKNQKKARPPILHTACPKRDRPHTHTPGQNIMTLTRRAYCRILRKLHRRVTPFRASLSPGTTSG